MDEIEKLKAELAKAQAALAVLDNIKRENAELRNINEKAGAEIEKLRTEITELRRQDNGGLPKELEELVKEKMAAGLPRATALESARNQIAWDKEQKKAKRE